MQTAFIILFIASGLCFLAAYFIHKTCIKEMKPDLKKMKITERHTR